MKSTERNEKEWDGTEWHFLPFLLSPGANMRQGFSFEGFIFPRSKRSEKSVQASQVEMQYAVPPLLLPFEEISFNR
jgi:hypothetical protein